MDEFPHGQYAVPVGHRTDNLAQRHGCPPRPRNSRSGLEVGAYQPTGRGSVWIAMWGRRRLLTNWA